MIITEDIAKKVGYHDSVEIDGVMYMYDSYKADYTLDGGVSYFKALKLGAEIDIDDTADVLSHTDWYVGYPKKEVTPDALNEWSDVYDVDQPFLYER